MDILVPWKEGEGSIVITPGSNGVASVMSDVANEGLDRQQTVVFSTTKGNNPVSVSTTVSQEGKRQAFASRNGSSHPIPAEKRPPAQSGGAGF